MAKIVAEYDTDTKALAVFINNERVTEARNLFLSNGDCDGTPSCLLTHSNATKRLLVAKSAAADDAIENGEFLGASSTFPGFIEAATHSDDVLTQIGDYFEERRVG